MLWKSISATNQGSSLVPESLLINIYQHTFVAEANQPIQDKDKVCLDSKHMFLSFNSYWTLNF